MARKPDKKVQQLAYLLLKEAGICARCRNQWAEKPYPVCADCREYMRVYLSAKRKGSK